MTILRNCAFWCGKARFFYGHSWSNSPKPPNSSADFFLFSRRDMTRKLGLRVKKIYAFFLSSSWKAGGRKLRGWVALAIKVHSREVFFFGKNVMQKVLRRGSILWAQDTSWGLFFIGFCRNILLPLALERESFCWQIPRVIVRWDAIESTAKSNSFK